MTTISTSAGQHLWQHGRPVHGFMDAIVAVELEAASDDAVHGAPRAEGLWDEAQAWADEAARRSDPELGTPAAEHGEWPGESRPIDKARERQILGLSDTPAEALPERPSIEDEWYEQDSGGGDDSAKGADVTSAQVVTSLPRPSSDPSGLAAPRAEGPPDDGRWSRGGWHYIACWFGWATDPENRPCVCDRLQQAVAVQSCSEHDEDGPTDEASGFPTCAKCAAILTEGAAPRAEGLDVDRLTRILTAIHGDNVPFPRGVPTSPREYAEQIVAMDARLSRPSDERP